MPCNLFIQRNNTKKAVHKHLIPGTVIIINDLFIPGIDFLHQRKGGHSPLLRVRLTPQLLGLEWCQAAYDFKRNNYSIVEQKATYITLKKYKLYESQNLNQHSKIKIYHILNQKESRNWLTIDDQIILCCQSSNGAHKLGKFRKSSWH